MRNAYDRSGCVREQDLSYSVMSNSTKGEKVALLKNLTGCFSPQQMSALVRSHATKQIRIATKKTGHKSKPSDMS